MTSIWRPSEIIINEAVRNDPVTKHILSLCTDLEYSVKYVSDSKPKTIHDESEMLAREHDSILHAIGTGKFVMHITEASNTVLGTFEMEDPRMMCPEFDKLVLASNGCFYNCDWCFLKGTYRANQNYITVRVQYDKIKDMLTKRLKTASAPVMFDTGEMADSLSMEHLTRSGQELIPWFADQPNGYMYMLTKSTNVEPILKLKHNKHTVLAWSINATMVSNWFEVGAPKPMERLRAAKLAQKAGYPIRIRLDPIIPVLNWKQYYSGIIKSIFEEVKPERITLGTLRFEGQLYKVRNAMLASAKLKELADTLVPMLDKIKLPNGKMSVGKYSFPVDQRIDIFKFVIEEIRKYSKCDIALCKETTEVWKAVGLDLEECKCVCQYDCADMVNRPEKEVITVAKGKNPGIKAVQKAQPIKKVAAPRKVLLDAVYEPRTLYHLDIDLLAPDPDQPRKSIDEAELKELTASIEKHGVLLPILFRKNDKGELVIVSGERRYQASLLAKNDTIPAILVENNAAEIALVENLLRVDLTAIEEAEALQRLKTEAKYSNKQLSNVIGKAEATISEILKLNQLPIKIRNKYRTDKSLSRRSLLEVSKAPNEEAMKKLFKKVLKKESKRDDIRAERTAATRGADVVCRTMSNGLLKVLPGLDLASVETERRTEVESVLKNALDALAEKLGYRIVKR